MRGVDAELVEPNALGVTMIGLAGRLRTLSLLAISVWGIATSVHAADVTVLCSQGLKTALDELIPHFERASGD